MHEIDGGTRKVIGALASGHRGGRTPPDDARIGQCAAGSAQGQLAITASDLEVELVAATEVAVVQAGDITVPGRKLLDILRALPEKVAVSLAWKGRRSSSRPDGADLV